MTHEEFIAQARKIIAHTRTVNTTAILAKANEVVEFAKEKGFPNAKVVYLIPEETDLPFDSLLEVAEFGGIGPNEEFDVHVLVQLNTAPVVIATDGDGNIES